MYREWEKIEFPNKYYIWIWNQQGLEVYQEMDGKVKWGMMGDKLVEKSGRKCYITDRNRRSSWERQGIFAFCTCEWNEWMNMSYFEWLSWSIDFVGHEYALRATEIMSLVHTQYFITLFMPDYRSNLPDFLYPSRTFCSVATVRRNSRSLVPSIPLCWWLQLVSKIVKHNNVFY